ncbi:MAG: glycosyltransferase family 4 protein [Rhodospirillaceae bacterium]|nr:glycosyltransferase family 4 protein [Rhodospirillaceae bacterium]
MAKLRVLALPRYEPLGASSRVRMYQFEPRLRDAGIELTWAPLFSTGYLQSLYASGARPMVEVMKGYAKRVAALMRAAAFDLVWLEKECWPFAPALLDPGLLRRRARYMVEYDDATFHSYDQHPSTIVRRTFGGKIDAVMRAAEVVVAGNAYLADRARRAGAGRVIVLPSTVDEHLYAPRGAPRPGPFTIGWIGSPGSQHLLDPLLPLLAEMLANTGDRFVTVGARAGQPFFPGHVAQAWTLSEESVQVAAFDVGLMPVTDAPFERGKCGYKIVQYMACGIPVVASPVGVNRDIVIDGETGFLAATETEWRTALTRLRAEPELRRRMGEAGRRRFEQHYALGAVAPKLADALFAAAGRTR